MATRSRKSPGYRWARDHLLNTPSAAAAWAFQEKLEESQWYTQAQHETYQRKRLSELVRHAAANVPYYASAFKTIGLDVGKIDDPKEWRRIPLLTRAALQDNKASLTAKQVPAHHGKSTSVHSSGSTGAPVEALATELTGAWNRALILRGQLWALKRFDYSMAVIRRYPQGVADYPEGFSAPAWTDDLTLPVTSGPVFGLSAATATADQVRWLNRRKPDVLFLYPTQLAALLDPVERGELDLSNLKRVLTISETLEDEVRVRARRLLGVEIFDAYSANEAGSIALQCPEGNGYHVQSEAILVEVLDDAGEPCLPEKTGRVVLTLLHNYALPLIRYDIGDLATVGRRCRCGRGLPLLTRIVGRQRNMMIGPRGQRSRPALGWRHIRDIAPVEQGQFVQHTIERLEARLVVARPLTEAEESALRRHLRSRMSQFSEIEFTYVDQIPRTDAGKFEDFVSLVQAHDSVTDG